DEDCEADYDTCIENPCPQGTNCTDLDPEQEIRLQRGYNCTDCPTGLALSENKCLDIDECSASNPCDHNCFNTEGSYYCTCDAGYRVAQQTCLDVDECVAGNGGCEQMCINDAGSFSCGCAQGFSLTSDGKTCNKDQDQDPCVALNQTSTCAYACRVNSLNNQAECFCKAGQTVNPNGSCSDIDECQENPCTGLCTNTDGSFTCSCLTGYKLLSDRLNCEGKCYLFVMELNNCSVN
ncbi:fibulin-5-like, partial [Liolophura sinensis]|uniref:fibulin-5-like n=1 Tax=Liolophura sinensis TaxID=3198878 RepID=UPI0031596E05